MSSRPDLPSMYREFADWFHVLTPPEEYEVEAEFYATVWTEAAQIPVESVLELGSGGGNNALHLKSRFRFTLSDLSEEMLDVSRSLHPDLEHIQGDMRTLRLNRQFDVVFIHDAIVYMTTEWDLKAAITTAFEHCRPGGAAVFAPDESRETFSPKTDHGGTDREGRSLRYLEWVWDPDPDDTTYVADYAYLMREDDGEVTAARDHHLCGVFSRSTWLRLIEEAGFRARRVDGIPGETGPDIFVGVNPKVVSAPD